MANFGFVYILSNDAMPGVYKIGFTDRAPMARCQELSGSTSVPVAFDIVAYAEVEDASGVENSIHSEFEGYRIAKNREFFRLTLQMLEQVIDELVAYSINFIECEKLHFIRFEEEKNKPSYKWSAIVHYLSSDVDDREMPPPCWSVWAEDNLYLAMRGEF